MTTTCHLDCLQTPGSLPDDESRSDFYATRIVERAPKLKEFARSLVYDGAAAKTAFVDLLVEHPELHLISKLRKNANLRDLYTGPRRLEPGRPKCYDGKMDCKHPDLARFERCYEDDEVMVYTAVVNSPGLKRTARIAYVKDKHRDAYVILFGTDVNLDGAWIYRYYTARFQIEFLFRDGGNKIQG